MEVLKKEPQICKGVTRLYLNALKYIEGVNSILSI